MEEGQDWYSGSSSGEEEEEQVVAKKQQQEWGRKRKEDSEEEWEEVGAKQRKKKQWKEEEKSSIVRDSKGNPISKEKQKFLKEYAQLSSHSFSTGSFYDHIQDLDDLSSSSSSKSKKNEKNKVSDKTPSRKFINSKGEFIGEQLEFKDLSKPTKPSKSKKNSSSSSKSTSSSSTKGIKNIASSINVDDLKSYLRGCQESDGDQIPFKLLTDYLENLFLNATGSYSARTNLNNPELPFSLLSNETQREIQDSVQDIPEQLLVPFLWSLVQRLIPHLKKTSTSSKGIGLQILIQAISRTKPICVVKNHQNLKDTFTKSQILTKSATPLLLWIFSQITDRSLALSEWFQFLLPVLFDPSQSEYHSNIIAFVSNIIQTRSSVIMDESSATMAYERLMLYKASGKEIPKELNELLPRLMDKNFLFSKSNPPKKFFTMLLGHSATEKEALRDEVLPALVKCLESDNTFFTIWEEAYPKYIAQSSNLLLYITLNWEKLHEKIPAEQILSLGQKFGQTNKTLKRGKSKLSTESEKEIEMCNATCKLLKAKLKEFGEKKGKSFICTTIIPLAILVAGVVTYLAKCQSGECIQFAS
eukprot:TRINITY_DN1642_c0_g1_i1.p1 TRINITY_DN1642_c0_g1~~TRINITY_DN1642_c0_g1_i1.p1  ORF type:complete len:669 (+),score=147.78 TRINITY_DN1642_c0_g1_i1:250-2007(+)